MAVLLRHKVPTYVVGSGRGRRTQGVNWTPFRAGGGFAQSSFFLPFPDLGNGAVDTMEGRGQVTPSFVRATAAATKLSTGLWKLDVASGVARSAYLGATTAIGSYGGYFVEGAASQLALNPRDMTQAAWSAVNVTPAQTSVGITGVTNSASRLTSAAIGASILQTVVAAATSRTYSVWLRRVTGTGTITISQGATTLDVTASLNSSTFTRVELAATVLNSAFGITFGASGDVIEADCNQFEAGGFASSPIPVGGRNPDVLSYPGSILNSAVGTAFASFTCYRPDTTSTNPRVIDTTNTTGTPLFLEATTRNIALFDGATRAGTAVTLPANSLVKVASAWSGSSSSIANAGVVTAAAFDGNMNFGVSMFIGNTDLGPGNELGGTVRNVTCWPRRLSNQQLQVLTS